jgi:hypothetical protein
MSNIIKIALIFTLIIGSIPITLVHLSSAQETDTYKISGYILDSNGNGLKGANIIFNVPSIVPSVFSDSLGYYEIFAPQDTYQINVWPPFDSNYIRYEETEFTVDSDITKNITLILGNKVSGYVLDDEGKPVQQAIVALDNYITGHPSDYSGYYFCTAPSGTYELRAAPRKGYEHFSSYSESNFVVNGDITKNIVVSNHTSIETQPPVPEPSEPQEPPKSAFFYDNFDDGVADGWTEQVGSWMVNNGEYCVSVVTDAISIVDGLSFTDCTIETTFRLTDLVGFRAGIIFRYIDSTHYYGLHISNEYDSIGISKYTPEASAYGDGLISVKGNIFQSNTDYHLKIVIKGDLFTCYVNGEEIFSINDDSYAYGGVGLRARRADVCFDNFIVDDATIADVEIPEPISEELLAWWKLDEGNGTFVLDSSVYNHHGTINGANWLNYQGDSALNFDGESDYVSLPSIDLTKLDSFTVVARINSDLTQAGDFIYQGNLGEFSLSNGEIKQSSPSVTLDSTYAKFSVKLANYQWYKVDSSFPMKPNTWHQVVGVWEKGKSLKIYVDGYLAGENKEIPSESLYNPGASFPSSLGIYAQSRWNYQEGFFKGQLSNVMIFNSALTPQEIEDQYDVSVPVVPRPILDVSCESLFSPYSGLNIEIKGKLTLSGEAMVNAPILLSYSVNGGKTWQDLTMINTISDGTYSVTWTPFVTGVYRINAVYEGGVDYLPAFAAVNYSVTQDKEQNVFSVNSNSTVSSLAFNSTSRTLSFSVTGESGTSGYAYVSFSKILVQNIDEIKVLVDLDQLEHTLTETEDSCQVYFQYKHSTHNIIVNLGTFQVVAEESPENYTYFIAITASLVILTTAVIILQVKRNKNKTSKKWFKKAF